MRGIIQYKVESLILKVESESSIFKPFNPLNMTYQDKKLLRKEIRRRVQKYSPSILVDMSQPVIKRMMDREDVVNSEVVLMYYSLPDEVYSHEAIQTLASMGKNVLLPVVVDGENLELREFDAYDSMKQGAFNIMEPVGRRFLNYDEIDVAVIPGLAFDRKGGRLGRGKGYYDRLLSKLPDCRKLGMCFDFQMVDAVPAEAHDIKMDDII